MRYHRLRVLLLICAVLLIHTQGLAEEPFRYPEAKHGRGELKYVQGIPVLSVAGTPAEIGQQLGVLGFEPASRLTQLADDAIREYGWEKIYSLVLKTGNIMLPQFPTDHLAELDAAAAAAPSWKRELLVFGNTVTDLRRVIQCSTFIVDPGRSATGGPLFGRNLDWPPFRTLADTTMVVVYRPQGKRAFASITFPGLLGCTSGMNDAGLAVAVLEVHATRDGAPKFNPRGVPSLLALRRVLEECTTVDEAAKLLRSLERATILNVAVCDRRRGAVLEVTPKNVVVRPSADGLCICTNHFRSDELATITECRRYEALQRSPRLDRYHLADVAERMHKAHQGPATLQTMIFEPAALRLHLAYGPGPATALEPQTLELAELFEERKTVP